jgi:hypothetical protein
MRYRWRPGAKQKLPADLVEPIRRLNVNVRQILLRAPRSGNVTEWNRTGDCWKRVRAICVKPIPSLYDNLKVHDKLKERGGGKPLKRPSTQD